MTVLGPIKASELGRTMPHEHLLCKELGMGEGPLDDLDGAIVDLRALKDVGGGAIVDLTSGGLGRQPGQLRRASEESGVHIVMGAGWYRESFYPEDFNQVSVGELTERLLADIAEGEGGIRPGVIGEIGADHAYLSGVEERVLRACARAQLQTGLGIVLHAVLSEVGAWQLDVLEEEGVDLRRVGVGHCDLYPNVDYHSRLAQRGAFVMYDTQSFPSEELAATRIANAAEMVRRGYGEQLLISHDVCTPSGRRAGGGPGYSRTITDTMPGLVEAGVAPEVTEQIMTANVWRLLAGTD
ncbi:phosphotriesterase-related protein [Catenulispora yoronensis]|uniref:Phosphotriesterase-related protein n=2 Tax=Catenulispora yoronensis TaxID=450799 RepID=A0ABP5EWS3_9ACTN